MNWPLFINSLAVAGTTAVVATLFGLVAAVALSALPQRALRLGVGVAIVTLAMPPFLVTNCWLDLLGAGGLLRRLLPVDLFSLPGAVWILSLLFWPVPALLAWSAWRKIEPAQLEIDPALRGRALFRWLLWPMAKTSLGLGAAIVFVLALNQFSVPAILQVKVYPADVWISFNTQLRADLAFRQSWPLIAAPALLLAALYLGRREFSWPREQQPASARLLRRQLGPVAMGLSGIVGAVLVLLSVLLPLGQLALERRTWSEFLPAVTASLNALGNSVAFAGGAAALALALALATWRWRVLSVLWLIFFVPGVLLGIALIVGLNRPEASWFYRSFGIVLLAFVLRYGVLAWNLTRQAMLGLDRDVIDSARLDGARGWTLFRRIQWPQIAPQLLAGAYVVYLLCLWDVETLVMIAPPGGETLALRVFNLLHYGHNAHVNAICVLLLLLALAPLILAEVLLGMRALARGRRETPGPEAPETAAAPPVTAILVCAVVAGGLAGCSPRSESTTLDSRLFSHVEIIGSRGTGPGQFNKPRSLALDTNDNLFVVDMTGRVQKFSPWGEFLLSWQMPQTDLGKPKGMDRDRNGNIVIIEPHYQRVNHFTPEGRLVARWGSRGRNCGELTLPRAVAIDTKGDIIISEYTIVDRVQKFSGNDRAGIGRSGVAPSDGTRNGSPSEQTITPPLLGCWGEPGLRPGAFNRAEGLGVDRADRIYVADSCNHRIQIFAPEGTFLRTYGRAGSGPGELSYPYDVRVDAEGRQYVCEFGNSRIQVFDASSRSLEIIGRAGAKPGEFANPWAIAFDSQGNLYVADAQNHRVQKLVRRKGVQ